MVNFPMQAQTEHVLQKLFSENSLDNIPLERLKQIVAEHPYFTLGHLMLTKKLQTLSAPEYQAQSERTSLYFNEPIWLQSLLHPSGEIHHIVRERIDEEPLPQAIEVINETPVEEREELVPEESEALVPEVQQTIEISEPEPAVRLTETVVENNQPENQEPIQIFEPYHTVDYFASQGIKISNEIKPDDRLGRQLKSFTEWLKTMKRLPETKVEEQLDEVAQQNIQDFAAHSLDEKEVVTESMAEVLIKQHKEEEAVVIYEKLSLLNPSKRAYFAAKIEQLKG